jgi:hypothetical protein
LKPNRGNQAQDRMRNLILLLIAICTAQFGFSQSDYRKGYVITNAGDTLFGLVDYREGAKAYKLCDFKSSENHDAVTYEPGTVAGYGFENDKFFQSREFSAKDQPSKIVFFEVIVRGLVSLYRFEQAYFIEKNGSGLQQLINETKEIEVDGKRVVKHTNQHIGIMSIVFFDCDEIRSEVQTVKLTERSLTNLVEHYNRCQGGSSTTFKVNKPWTKFMIGLSGGLNISQLNFETVYRHLAGNFETSKSPMAGISLDILSPKLNERISFHTEIIYLTSKYYSYSLNENAYYTIRDYVSIELQQLKIPVGFRYSFPMKSVSPYFNVGISSTIHLSSHSVWIQELESGGRVTTDNYEALTIKKNQFGIWGGVGISKSVSRKLAAFTELRYEQTDGISQNSIPQAVAPSEVSNFQIIIGIRTK